MTPGTAGVGGRAGESSLSVQVSLRALPSQAPSPAGASRIGAHSSEEGHRCSSESRASRQVLEAHPPVFQEKLRPQLEAERHKNRL